MTETVDTRTLLRMDLARAPEKEGEQDAAAVLAYNRTADWPPFRLLRRMTLRRLEMLDPHGVLLDAGCGPGQLAIAIGRRFPGLKVTGLDNNPDMLAAALRNGSRAGARNVAFQAGDVQDMPYVDGSLDFIVSTISLHHWQDAAVALGEIYRVLAPGGRLLLMDLRRDCARWFYCGLVLMQRFAMPAAIRRTNGAVGSLYASYTIEEIRALLGTTRFHAVQIEPAPGWVFLQAVKG